MLAKLIRLFKHRWQGDDLTRRVLPPKVLDQLTQAVQASEKRHSGEIRIDVEGGLPSSYLWRDGPLPEIIRSRAVMRFSKLRVWDTAHNNGVLIYVLLAERAIEIVADRGLNDKVSSDTWRDLIAQMRESFRQGRFEDGLHQAVDEVSRLLDTHFPLASGAENPNELPDSPSVR
ncbi:MAG: hypothetical protein BWK72_07975 [Rhodoferax ferrireducens]|uniref:TPM domain-containing protein n=2 Tax=Pseudomonadota TaxID=1224 RepID=A0A1Y1QZT9_9GAMM|nr:MAG: hypothetical protein BWK72_07975 [Rhodoferax ferrireducens]OQX17421.1 MAG: hypothetical protein BWK73_01755 [Thiothrix lacustris]